MQIYVLASVALLALSAVEATASSGSSSSSHSGSNSGLNDGDAGVVNVNVNGTAKVVGDWQACTEQDVACESETSACVRHSKYYAQCKPEVLSSGDLCGQSDGTNEWEYDHCPIGEACVAHGVDSRCSKVKKIRHHHHKRDHSTDSGSASHSGNSTDEAVIYAITVADWQDCTLEIIGCESKTSVCVHQSEFYAQCKPAELPSGDLCGQSDGINEWLYDHCPTGETCEKNGPDFRCTKKKTQRKRHKHRKHHKHHQLSAHKTATTTVEDWQDCTKKDVTCKNKTSVCVKHSQYYSQCKPAMLPSGDLCGQSDAVNKWKYDHCPSDESCKAKSSDSHCVKK